MPSLEYPRICTPSFRLALLHAISALTALASLPACADDVASGEGTTETGTSSGGDSTGTTGSDSTDDGADSTGGGLEPPDPPMPPACNDEDDGEPIAGGSFQLFRDGGGAVPSFSLPLPNLATDPDIGPCPQLRELADGSDGTLSVRVYRPDAGGGAFPSGPLPLVIHHHGEGQVPVGYDYIGERLAEEGYVFLSVGTGSDDPNRVPEAIACTMAWLGSTDAQGGAQIFMMADDGMPDSTTGEWTAEDSRLRCADTVIMGHSQGAGRAVHFLRNRDADDLSNAILNPERFPPYWFDFSPAAFVGMAASIAQDDLPARLAVPTLLFGAGRDTDGGGAPKSLYDQNPREEDRFVEQGKAAPRFLFWVPSAGHDSFGGAMGSGPGGFAFPSVDSSAASAAVATYLPRFLEWQVEGDDVEDNRRVLQQETFPGPLNKPSHYVSAEAYGLQGYFDCSATDETSCDATDGCFWDEDLDPDACATQMCGAATDEPTCSATPGCWWDSVASDCVDLDCEAQVFGDCEAVPGCVEWNCGQDGTACDDGADCCSGSCVDDKCDGDGNSCRPRPAVHVMFTPDTTTGLDFAYPVEHFTPSTECFMLSAEPECEADSSCSWVEGMCFADEQVCPDRVVTSLASGQVRCEHVDALLAAVEVNASSLHDTGVIMVRYGPGETTAAGSVTLEDITDSGAYNFFDATHLSFRVANVRVPEQASPYIAGEAHPLTFGVRLRSEDQDPAVTTPYLTTPLIPVQQTEHFYDNETTMTTVRIAMADLCAADSLETTEVDALDFFFDDHGLDRTVLIDTIEVTYTNDDYPDLACSSHSGMYACPATGTFEATLTTCGGEPISGVCQVGDILTDTVDPPEVFDGSSNIDGWLVHVGTGIIDDPMSPTASELAYIQDRCLQACEDEWQDDPDIRPNCSDTGALGTAYLVSSPSFGSRQAIPTAERDGSGIFTGESLSCNLHSDCCLEFDEDLCTAAPSRVTPQRQPLGTHEEYRITLDPATSEVTSTSGTGDTALLNGEIGYSFCRDGNGGGPCPFYVGSMHLEASSSLDVDVQCPDGSFETITMDNLEIDLAQPAMGIDSTGGPPKGFPSRSLVFDAAFDVASQPYVVRGLNEIPVTIAVAPLGFEAVDIPFRGEAPCTSGGTGLTRGEFHIKLNLSSSSPTESPPTVSITMPSSTTCGDREGFSATTSDPDNDIVSTRWYVDDVLMDAGESYVYFNSDHDIRAVVRDARGATATDEVTITCTP